MSMISMEIAEDLWTPRILSFTFLLLSFLFWAPFVHHLFPQNFIKVHEVDFHQVDLMKVHEVDLYEVDLHEVDL